MPAGNTRRRVLIALTETGSVRRLWQALNEILREVPDSEILAIFLADDNWHRAASLPFTREVLMHSGAVRDFTPQRAREIVDEAAGRTRSELETLASESGSSFTFQIVTTTNEAQLEGLAIEAGSLVVAPSELAGSRVHALLERLSCEIVLVETE